MASNPTSSRLAAVRAVRGRRPSARAPLPRAEDVLPPVLSLIGNTPLIPLHFRAEGITLHVKCEYLNPSGSIKDRLALMILGDARRRGLLRPDTTVLECTSGNTGIALAMVGALLGVRVRILMSDTASIERRHLMRHFGAELQLFSATRGYVTGIEISEAMAKEDARYFLPRQFENPLNAQDHVEHTGREILSQMGGRVDAFVSGYGTGGTINGVSRALRARNPRVKIVAMEPAEAAMLSGESPCCHNIEGVAGGYIPPLIKGLTIDAKEKVASADAIAMTRRLASEFGLLVGTSSGANIIAALRTAAQLPEGSRVVTILCDRAERYYSTKLFAAPLVSEAKPASVELMR